LWKIVSTKTTIIQGVDDSNKLRLAYSITLLARTQYNFIGSNS
jgi:hypothetical protein